MATKIFLTGATGYIGGTVLNLLTTSHPEYEITALVRSGDKASLLKAAFPAVTPLIGSLDDVELLAKAAGAAGIVVHTAHADHSIGVQALISGKPRFLIHTSGLAILPDISDPNNFGHPPSQNGSDDFSDIEDLQRIISFDEKGHLHRDVDKIVIAASERGVKSAIVCPPCIYGTGTGPDNIKSAQFPLLAATTLKLKYGIAVGEGRAEWSVVHVQDLAGVYLKLVEAAARDGEGADWFDGVKNDGYYFAENGRVRWEQVAEKVVEIVWEKGWLETEEAVAVRRLAVEEVNEKAHPFGGVLWGTNALCRADRARKVLGWEATEVGWEATLEAAVEEAAKDAGLAE